MGTVAKLPLERNFKLEHVKEVSGQGHQNSLPVLHYCIIHICLMMYLHPLPNALHFCMFHVHRVLGSCNLAGS